MKILVPIKRVADPDNANKVKVSADGTQVTTEGLEWKMNPFDEWALEAALRLTEVGSTGSAASAAPSSAGDVEAGAASEVGADACSWASREASIMVSSWVRSTRFIQCS